MSAATGKPRCAQRTDVGGTAAERIGILDGFRMRPSPSAALTATHESEDCSALESTASEAESGYVKSARTASVFTRHLRSVCGDEHRVCVRTQPCRVGLNSRKTSHGPERTSADDPYSARSAGQRPPIARTEQRPRRRHGFSSGEFVHLMIEALSPRMGQRPIDNSASATAHRSSICCCRAREECCQDFACCRPVILPSPPAASVSAVGASRALASSESGAR